MVAAGDIACSSGSAETATTCRQTETGQLLGGATAVLTLGDNQYEAGSLPDYTASFDQSWGVARSVMHPVPGNHEYATPNAQGYRDYFGYSTTAPLYYSWDLGAWHIVALDSEMDTAAGSVQEQWLRADLAAHPNACTLAYWHKPLFSSGEHGPNSVAAPLWADLYAAGADVVLNGHDHDYERFALQDPAGTADPARGIREFVVGTGGRSHYIFVTSQANSEVGSTTTFGVLKLTLHASSYDWQFVPEAGATFTDAGSSVCNSPAAGGNTAPTANPVSVTATTGILTPWLPGVSDPDPGTVVTCSIASQPAHGVATVAADCSTGTYVSNSGFVGSDPFTYRANDGALDSLAAAVSVSVGSGGGAGAILQVQQVVTSGSAATLPISIPTTGSGHALVIAVAVAAGSSASVLNVTDSAGGPWTKGSVGYLTGTNSRVEIWYRLGAPPVTSVTVALSTAKMVAANFTEWSGVSQSIDVALGGNQASAATVATPALATRTAPDLVIGAMNYPAVAASTLVGGPFAELTPFNASTSVHGRAAWLVTSTVGTSQASWTLSAASGGTGGAIVAFVGAP